MKWLWRILALLVVLVVVALGALFLVPTSRIAALATDRFEAATGRTLVLDGDVRPSLWPVLGVTTGAVQLGNSDWAGPEPFIEAARISIGIDPTTVFGEIRVTSIEIENPIIRLATDESGRANWEFEGFRESGQGDGMGEDARLPSLDSARINGGTLIFQPAGGPSIQLEDIDLTASFPDAAGLAELSVSGRSKAAKFAAQGQIAQLADFVNGQPVPVNATLSIGEAKAAFDGVAGLVPLELVGTFVGDASNPADIFGLLGLPAPEIPRGLGRDTVNISTTVALTETTLALGDLVAMLDNNQVRGSANVAFGGPRPVADAVFKLGNFDLSSIATGGETEKDSSGASTGWSEDPIDMSALGRLDGRISLEASSLRLGTASIDGLSTETTIENARAVTEIVRLRAYDGDAAGTLVLNARDGFSTRLNTAGSAFAISRLLAELVDYDQIVAAGDLRLDVLGVGNTMDALMNSLDGEGSFRVGAGELIGLDIVGMLRNLDPSYFGQGHKTIFDEITGTFRIVDGVVVNEDLRLTAPFFKATGAGKIGIGTQSLNFRVIPELLGGDNAGIKVPLLMTGTWQNPSVRLDLESALKSLVEEEVRDRIDEELRDSIGDSLEDTLKKGLEGLLKR